MSVVADELHDRITANGAVRFDEFVELVLYHPVGGFFAAGGGAGRAGADFLTSPEVGPLFGAVVARYLDRRWDELGRPDPFVVVEAAAGRGALAIAVLAAEPRCDPALHYVMVERSAALRARHADHLPLTPFRPSTPDRSVLRNGPQGGHSAGQNDAVVDAARVSSLDQLPSEHVADVVIANELLDNVPFRLFERSTSGWSEVFVTAGADPRPDPGVGSGDGDGWERPSFGEVLRPCDDATAARLQRLAPDVAPGDRVPLQDGAVEWLAHALELVEHGSVLVIDYTSTTRDLAARPVEQWLRTYRLHGRGDHPLVAPGTQDVTCEVALDQLAAHAEPTSVTTQADWLVAHGVANLVEEGRRIWAERATAPDLAAMRARSRVAESEALLDPDGLGGFTVAEWRV